MFSFDGIKAINKNLYVNKKVYQGLSNQQLATEKVAGKDGIYYFGSSLNEKIITFECSILPNFSYSDLIDVIDGVNEWLNPLKGLKPLIYDMKPDRYINAVLNTPINTDRLPKFSGTLNIEFIAPDPYWYAVNDDIVTIETIGTTNFNRSGNALSLPKIVLNGTISTGQSIDITFNDKQTLTIIPPLESSEQLEIDCSKMTVYKRNIVTDNLSNGLPLLDKLNFSELLPDNNKVEISINNSAVFNELKVYCQSRWF